MQELGETMGSAEFSLWAALYDVEPWDEHLDFGLGQVAATVANYAGKMRKEGTLPAMAADFMPLPKPKEPAIENPDPVAFFSTIKVDKK